MPKTDAQLRQEIASNRKLLRDRKRKALGLPKRATGKMCRPVDRDEAEKARRGYIETASYVRFDGSERLIGRDWRKRKQELALRSGGTCERFRVLGKPHDAFCSGYGQEPHHVIKRSLRRDDRLINLAHLSHECHDAEDPRKPPFAASGTRQE